MHALKSLKAMIYTISLASPLLGANVAGAQVPLKLQPHRVAYAVKLDPARTGSAITSAEGIIALEFSGNACKGFTTGFRQAAVLVDGDGGARQLDFNVKQWEEGASKRFRFTVHNTLNGKVTRDVDGEARKADDGSLSVSLRKPERKKSDLDGKVQFPAAMMAALIAEARKGERLFTARLYDGSEGGEKLYETTSTIGPLVKAEDTRRVEAVFKDKGFDSLEKWPVTTVYYEDVPGDRLPIYTMKNITYANGVVGDLTFVFPDFSLVAKAVRYENLPEEACNR